MDRTIVWLVGEVETIRLKIGITGIVGLVIMQLGAWYFDKNGIVTGLCVGGITAIIGYYFGKLKGFKAA